MTESFYILWTLPARYREEKMKVLEILKFVGLIAERIMFWKKNNNATKNERKEESQNGK